MNALDLFFLCLLITLGILTGIYYRRRCAARRAAAAEAQMHQERMQGFVEPPVRVAMPIQYYTYNQPVTAQGGDHPPEGEGGITRFGAVAPTSVLFGVNYFGTQLPAGVTEAPPPTNYDSGELNPMDTIDERINAQFLPPADEAERAAMYGSGALYLPRTDTPKSNGSLGSPLPETKQRVKKPREEKANGPGV